MWCAQLCLQINDNCATLLDSDDDIEINLSKEQINYKNNLASEIAMLLICCLMEDHPELTYLEDWLDSELPLYSVIKNDETDEILAEDNVEPINCWI